MPTRYLIDAATASAAIEEVEVIRETPTTYTRVVRYPGGSIGPRTFDRTGIFGLFNSQHEAAKALKEALTQEATALEYRLTMLKRRIQELG